MLLTKSRPRNPWSHKTIPFRALTAPNASQSRSNKTRALLKLGKFGVVGTALIYAFHACSSTGRHYSTDNSNPKLKGLKFVGNSTFSEGLQKKQPSSENGDKSASETTRKEAKQLPWKGLGFLRTSLPFDEISSTITSWTWPASLSSLQEKSSALLLELSRGPGSLFQQIVHDPPDLLIHPECQWDAEVRLGDDLCLSERAFLRERKRKMKKAFAKLFDVDEAEINEQDLPIVAIAGSGGGFRAMLNTTGSLIGAKQSGLLDCVTYISGISGSCWALGALYSGIAGYQDPMLSAQHLIQRIQTSYVDTSTLDLLTSPPTNKYLLSGLLRKANAPLGTASLVDLYGTLVSARLFIPEDISLLDDRFLSLHHFRQAIDSGSMPLPIFTAIHHEIPPSLEKPLAKAKEELHVSVDADRRKLLEKEEEDIERLSSWLWFEFTPYEVGCDDLGAWIPSWSLGRRFQNGKSIERIPELSFSILSGIFASAFCASLQHYFNEAQPILRQLPDQLYTWLNEIITERNDEFGVIHPVLPDELPNFIKGMAGLLRKNSPSEIAEKDTIGFLDAGGRALLNIPYYPLLRREVDCIIALDASADSQDLWFTRAEQYAIRRGLTAWPKGARWPAPLQTPGERSDPAAAEPSESMVQPKTVESIANRALAEAQEKEASGQAKKVAEPEGSTPSVADETKVRGSLNNDLGKVNAAVVAEGPSAPRPLSACTIWMGSSTGSQESTPLEKLEEEDLMRRDGIAIVYNPLIPNEAVPGFDPMGVSTWLFSMEKDESEKLLKVAEANFEEGRGKIVKLLRAIWLRKKAKREGLSEKPITPHSI